MGDNTESHYDTGNGETLSLELTTAANDGLPIYVSGNFNNWKEKDERFRLKQGPDGKYRFFFSNRGQLPEILEYKYLRGTWDDEELDSYGNPANNRIAQRQQTKIEDFVPLWKQNGLAYHSTFLPIAQVISERFEIPQLIKTRRITALLPHDYNQTDRCYPVLYLQDGQNLFDDFAPFGNWGVNKKLAVMAQKGQSDIIIVAIDHAEDKRIEEFTPGHRTRLGKGEGKKYVRFLADTLKPHIDKHFRTLPDRQYTGIGGSSMGGLISIYAGFMYPEVFSKLLVFSPSLWVAPNIFFHAINLEANYDMKIYLYGGGKEGATVVPNIKKFKRELEKQSDQSNIEFNLSIDPSGQHNEIRWGEEFPKAVEWLYFTKAKQSFSAKDPN